MCDDVCDVGDVGERLDASDSVCSDYQWSATRSIANTTMPSLAAEGIWDICGSWTRQQIVSRSNISHVWPVTI